MSRKKPEPKFKEGDFVQHKKSGEVAVISGGEPDYSGKTGWNYPCVWPDGEGAYALESELVYVSQKNPYADLTDTPKQASGGLNSYYLAFVEHPQREDQPPYTAECEDIIEALDLTFDEGCIFKEIWRSANARLGNGKIGHKQLYGAEKINHYAKRILKQAQRSK